MRLGKNGFTLIEVLIAMLIVAIAYMAILKVSVDNIAQISYVKNKTVASWVGLQIINSIQAGRINIVSVDQKLEGKTVMLGRTWDWKTALSETKNKAIKEIVIDVASNSDNKQHAHLSGYFMPEIGDAS